MAITKPMLPPLKGYVEVEVDGERKYRNIETGRLLDDLYDPPTLYGLTEEVETIQEENRLLKAQIQAQSDRSDFVEECIAEMATQVYGGV